LKKILLYLFLIVFIMLFTSSLTFPAQKLKVGFIQGGGVDAPLAEQGFKNAGIEYETIEKDNYVLQWLLKYDVIAIGVVAYDQNEDLKANYKIVNEYVKAGGYLVTADYQQDGTWKEDYLPQPIKLVDDDIPDNTPVKIIDHPIWNTPNKITKEHFQNWGADDFAADVAKEVKGAWKAVLIGNDFPIVSVTQSASGVVVFSSLQVLQALGRSGNMKIAEVLQNLLFWRGPLSVSPKDKASTTWAKLKNSNL